MNNRLDSLLRCPLCERPLQAVQGGLGCEQGHHFDRARQGYFNLLPVQNKRSKQPGDDKAMILGRREFLDQQHYQPFSDAINQLINQQVGSRPALVVDAGCGEGYYDQRLLESANQELQLVGIDISKDAVRAACQRSKQALWLVASAANAPLPDQCADIIFSLFTPVSAKELYRLLKPEGLLIIASAGDQHLLELRERIYAQVEQKPNLITEQLANEFDHKERQDLRFTIKLESPRGIQQLLQMTPHHWRASQSAKAQLAKLQQLTVSTHFQIDCFTPKSH